MSKIVLLLNVFFSQAKKCLHFHKSSGIAKCLSFQILVHNYKKSHNQILFTIVFKMHYWKNVQELQNYSCVNKKSTCPFKMFAFQKIFTLKTRLKLQKKVFLKLIVPYGVRRQSWSTLVASNECTPAGGREFEQSKRLTRRFFQVFAKLLLIPWSQIALTSVNASITALKPPSPAPIRHMLQTALSYQHATAIHSHNETHMLQTALSYQHATAMHSHNETITRQLQLQIWAARYSR